MTTLNSELLDEIRGSVDGCLGTLELALAAVEDEPARRALQAVAAVLLTSAEHLSRVDAMVFHEPAADAPAGPVTMGQDVDPDCQHLDLAPITTMAGPAMYACADCPAIVEAPSE